MSKIPEKIWLQSAGIEFEGNWVDWTWSESRETEHDIEYIRAGIPLKEKLPPADESVLFYVPPVYKDTVGFWALGYMYTEHPDTEFGTDIYTTICGFNYDDENENPIEPDPTHWMPLPDLSEES